MSREANNKVYLIEWQDAHSSNGWHTDKEVINLIEKEKCICQEVGWILHENKEELVMAARKMKWAEDADCQWGMLQKIPKAWIRKKLLIKTDNC